jgi:hypothetical protein
MSLLGNESDFFHRKQESCYPRSCESDFFSEIDSSEFLIRSSIEIVEHDEVIESESSESSIESFSQHGVEFRSVYDKIKFIVLHKSSLLIIDYSSILQLVCLSKEIGENI